MSDKTEHTAGPWFVERSSDGLAICEADGHFVELLSEANARLIAAAPDLLEACRVLDNFWIDSGWRPPGEAGEERLLSPETLAVWRCIRDAIAKATDTPHDHQKDGGKQ